MKKLMMAAAIVCAAAFAQAATCDWSSGVTYLGAVGSELKTGSIKLGDAANGGGSGTAYLFVLGTGTDAAAAYAKLTDAATIYGGFNGSNKLTIDGTDYSLTASKAFTTKGKATLNDSSDYAVGSTVYAAVIVTHSGDGGKTIDLYSANGATALIDTAGGANSAAALRWGEYGGTGAATTWQAASVPEPTSGLLLLLGMAGLALRRRRA